MSADRTGFVDCTSLCTNGTLSDLSSEGTGLRIGFDFCRLLRTKERSTDFRDHSFLVSRCLSHFCFNYYYSAGTAIVFPSPWTYEKEAKSTIHGYIILVVKSTSGIKCLMLPVFSAIEVDYSIWVTATILAYFIWTFYFKPYLKCSLVRSDYLITHGPMVHALVWFLNFEKASSLLLY